MTADDLTIREVADQFGLTLRALRFYEDKGLIHPRRDGAKGNRFYDAGQVKRVGLITKWRAAGLDLKSIRQALVYLDADNRLGIETYVKISVSRIKKCLLLQVAAIEVVEQEPA